MSVKATRIGSSLLAGVLAAVLQACGVISPEPLASVEEPEIAEQQSDLQIEIDPCKSAEAHKILYVGYGYSFPPYNLPYAAKSGSGGYFYSGCYRYVVDVYLGETNPTSPSQQPFTIDITPAAHDLPSSAQAGGELPNNSLDCAAYRQFQTFYKKNASNLWDVLGSSVRAGVWSNGQCNLQTTSGALTELTNLSSTNDNGWDVYRVAMAVKLRSSGQEAKVTVKSDFIVY